MGELNHVSGIGRVAIGQQPVTNNCEQGAGDESCAADQITGIERRFVHVRADGKMTVICALTLGRIVGIVFVKIALIVGDSVAA
jgi:hypothetical protein